MRISAFSILLASTFAFAAISPAQTAVVRAVNLPKLRVQVASNLPLKQVRLGDNSMQNFTPQLLRPVSLGQPELTSTDLMPRRVTFQLKHRYETLNSQNLLGRK